MTHSRKSLKHRQLSAAHRAAKESGRLDDFYAQRDASRGVVTPPAAPRARAQPLAPPPPPPSPFSSYESISTPEGMIWREGERFPRWGLPINSDRRGLGHLRNPNI